MLAFAVDHPSPATIFLITGDRDYAYAVSTLKLRNYQVVLVVPTCTSPSLESQASLVVDWGAAVLRTRTEAVNSAQAVRQPYPDLDANLITKLLRELQEPPFDDSDATLHPSSSASQSTPQLRRISARDLLEPSRHSKNTGSLDSTEAFTHMPGSPRKSTSTGSDPAPGGLPIPKTPSRSRRASVSAGSTRARSTTLAAQSPPAVEQDVFAKNPASSSAVGSGASDITDVVGPAKHSASVLPSLDAPELPPHDNGPPSSIIIRSPLGPGQSTGDMPVSGNPGIPSSQKLSFLASPFVMPKAPTGLDSIPNPCTKQPHAPSTKTLTETVTCVCQTPQIKDIGFPKETERLTGPRIEDNDTNGWSTLQRVHAHSKDGSCDATYTLKSNYHSYVAPHTTYSPSSRNALIDTPSSGHVSPPAALPLGVGDGVDSAQFAAFSRASNTLERSTPGPTPVPSSSALPSIPFTTAGSPEHDESERRQTWIMFKPLIHLLLAARESGITLPSRSTIAVALVQSDNQVYQRAGVSKFRDYAALAEQAGIVELGGKDGGWIALHPNWFEMDGIASPPFLTSRVASPTPDPLKAIQNPFKVLTGSENPLIETATFQTRTFTSPRSNSPTSNTLPILPTARQGSASRTSIPAQFQPLIDILIRMRAEGSYQTLRSMVGSLLSQDVYARAAVPGFKEYVLQASEAQLVQFGGIGGHAWIRLHPELRI